MVNVKKIINILRDENMRLSEKLNVEPIKIDDDNSFKDDINEIYVASSIFEEMHTPNPNDA